MAMGLSQVSFKALSSPQGLFSRACSPGPPRDNQKLAGVLQQPSPPVPVPVPVPVSRASKGKKKACARERPLSI
ncbi:hypothetical protein VDGL01_03648 [Verticillium dahliae]